MASRYLFSKILGPSSHLPSWLLIIGYPIFWLELYGIRLPYGHSSWLAWGIFGVCLLMVIHQYGRQIVDLIGASIHGWAQQSLTGRGIILLAIFLSAAYLIISLYASILPPHLIQESDALNYHMMLPRQHLIYHSFTHIPWSTADLYVLPIDYALSPFWLSTAWPNKFVQFVFLIGILGCVFNLVYIWSDKSKIRSWVAVVAVMSCHIIAIQAGTAMLDLVILYCFLAFIHSLLSGRFIFAAIEFTFFVWSKSFMFPQTMIIGLILGGIIFFMLRRNFSMSELIVFKDFQIKIFGIVFIICSLVVSGPFLIKSFYYTGTPIFPLGVGLLSPVVEYSQDHWQAIVQKAQQCVSTKDGYGHGRSVVDFIKHFWLMAVPEKGVNNAFDYPVGLIYLLVFVPFIWHLKVCLRNRKLPLISVIIVLWWMVWWFTSQQTRFLLIPIILMIMIAIAFMPKLSKVFISLVVLALGFEVISLVNAHRSDWGKPYWNLLRDKDKNLIVLETQKKISIGVDYPDVAFSPLAVDVHNNDSVFVIPNP